MAKKTAAKKSLPVGTAIITISPRGEGFVNVSVNFGGPFIPESHAHQLAWMCKKYMDEIMRPEPDTETVNGEPVKSFTETPKVILDPAVLTQ